MATVRAKFLLRIGSLLAISILLSVGSQYISVRSETTYLREDICTNINGCCPADQEISDSNSNCTSTNTNYGFPMKLTSDKSYIGNQNFYTNVSLLTAVFFTTLLAAPYIIKKMRHKTK